MSLRRQAAVESEAMTDNEYEGEGEDDHSSLQKLITNAQTDTGDEEDEDTDPEEQQPPKKVNKKVTARSKPKPKSAADRNAQEKASGSKKRPAAESRESAINKKQKTKE